MLVDADQAVDQLLQSIRDGDERKAEKAVKILARDRSNVDFSLINQNSSKKKKTTASSSVLEFVFCIFAYKILSIIFYRLNVQIECHLDRDPITETIYIPSGTTLRTLKSKVRRI